MTTNLVVPKLGAPCTSLKKPESLKLVFDVGKNVKSFPSSLSRPVYTHPSRHISQQQQRPLHPVEVVSRGSEVRAPSQGFAGHHRRPGHTFISLLTLLSVVQHGGRGHGEFLQHGKPGRQRRHR